MIFDEELCQLDKTKSVLDIDLRNPLGLRYRLTSWDSGMDVFSDEGAGLHPSDCLDAWDFAWTGYENSHPIFNYAACIPEEALQLCRNFEHYKLGMLRLLKNVQESADLIRDIPALAWLLPEQKELLGMDWDDMKNVCRMRRKAILQFLFGHGSKSLVKLLQTIECRGSRSDYALLRAIACKPELQNFLCHTHSVNLNKVTFLLRSKSILNYAWFRNAFHDENFFLSHSYISNCTHLANDIIEMGKTLGIHDAELTVSRCPDFNRLYRLHERWVIKLNTMKDVNGGGVEFGPPPLEGSNTITPIANESVLNIEGKLMSHCVASYKEKILSKSCYIYRVLKPQRGTLEIRLNTANQCMIGQYKLYANREPSKESWKAVHDWFESRNGISRTGGHNNR